MYMLDTDICSYIIKNRHGYLEEILDGLDDTEVCVSVITQAELLYGLAKYPDRKKLHNLVRKFLKNTVIMDWDSLAAEEYAHLRYSLEKKGRPGGNFDMMIAAHALSVRATLVSNNVRHFTNVPKLKTENWV